MLTADEQRTFTRRRQLDRPSLRVAVAQARARTGEAEVGGVVVDRLEIEDLVGSGDDAVYDV